MPNFTNKTVSVIWMLVLALTLVLVDYFLSPVVTENGWFFQKVLKVLKVDKMTLTKLHCDEAIKKYISTVREQKYSAKACLNNTLLVLVKESNYKGELLIYDNGKMERIAANIQQPDVISISSEGEIFIQEHGRDRILKFFRK